jgi:hypothetical protein
VIPDFSALFAFCDLHASRWRQHPRIPRLFGAFPPLYYDRQGFPIPGDDAAGIEPVIAWARYREGAGIDDVRVAYDELPDGSHLSTVWLGIDHQWGLGPPLIFETMRFCDAEDVDWIEAPDGTRTEIVGHKSHDFPDPFGEPGETTEQLRYSTEEEALAAHHEIVRRLRIREGH